MTTHRDSRPRRLADAWKNVGKVFMLALVLNVVYQVIVTRIVRPK